MKVNFHLNDVLFIEGDRFQVDAGVHSANLTKLTRFL